MRRKKMNSRAAFADELIRKGKSVKEAARIAGVSEFWLGLRVDKSKIGVLNR